MTTRDEHTDAVAHYAVNLALYAARNQSRIGYTQGDQRWSGIDGHILYPKLPPWADCSAFTTWDIWAARIHVRGNAGVDIINGQRWQAGYTGTQIEHGARHRSTSDTKLWHPGRTLVFYADRGTTPTHVAMFVGDILWNGQHLKDQVVSHGSQNDPRVRPFNYRRIVQARAYPV